MRLGFQHALTFGLCGAILCNSNDHVLIQQPGFPLTHSALAFNNATVESIPCRFDSAYRVDVKELAVRLKPDTSLVCLASPQNPSGVALSQQHITEILDVMASHSPNAFLLLDETYRQADYGTGEYLHSPVNTDARVISTASLSKCHGTPGLRIGWAITRHQEFRQQLINGKFQTVIACSGLDEAVATRVLQASEDSLANRRTHLRTGRDTVAAWVARHTDQLGWVPPDAGALCCIRLHPAKFDSQQLQKFHRDLLQHSVRIAPGPWFGDDDNVFRLGFGLLPIEQLNHGLEIISHVLKDLR